MRFTATTKDCLFSDLQIHMLERQSKKMVRFLPHLAVDLPLMNVTVKKHEKRDTYRGTYMLQLPKKTLIVRTEAESVDLLLKKGFEGLMGKLQTYKGKHFVSNSEYNDHSSIKQSTFFVDEEVII